MKIPPATYIRRNSANERTVLVLFLSYLSFSMFRLSIGMALPSIISEMKISEFQAGILYSINLLSSAILLTPSGLMADRIGRKRVLILGYLLLAAGVLSFSSSPNYPLLVVSLTIAGVGSSMIIPSYYSLMGELLRNVRGFGVGLGLASYQIGGLMGSYLVGAFVALGNWRVPFIIMGVLEIIALLVQIPLVHPPPSIEEKPTTFFSLLKMRNILVSCTSIFLGSFGYFSTTAWLPSLLLSRSIGPIESSLILGLFFIGGAMSPPAFGRISERIGRKKTTFYISIAAAVVAAVALLISHPLISAICVVLLGIFISPHRSLLVTIVQEAVPEKNISAATGLTQTLGLFGGAVGPVISGALIPPLTIDYALFYSIVLPNVLCGLITLLIREKWPAA